jgi:hypothetical protein
MSTDMLCDFFMLGAFGGKKTIPPCWPGGNNFRGSRTHGTLTQHQTQKKKPMEEIAKRCGVDLKMRPEMKNPGGGAIWTSNPQVQEYYYLCNEVVRRWFSTTDGEERKRLEECADALKKATVPDATSDEAALTSCMRVWKLPEIEVARFLLNRKDEKKYRTPMECVGDIIGQEAVPAGVSSQPTSLLSIVTSCITSFTQNRVSIVAAA